MSALAAFYKRKIKDSFGRGGVDSQSTWGKGMAAVFAISSSWQLTVKKQDTFRSDHTD